VTHPIDAVPAPDAVAEADAGSAALAACPNLASVDGPWHAAAPSRAHRCRLLAEGRPTLDRQREHCLGAAHVACPTWLEAHGAAAAPARPGPFVAMAPVVLEGPGIGMPSNGVARRLAAPVTVVVVAAALGALLLARGPLAPGSSGAGDDGPSATPMGSAAAAATARPTTLPTAAPTARPTARPTATTAPTATPRPRTYRIKPGDTLTAIAARFGTTATKLAALNNIKNPSLIRVGQVIKLP
jgi:LysM repeat protein